MIFTSTYWRFQFKAIFAGQAPLNIIEVVEFEIPDEKDDTTHG